MVSEFSSNKKSLTEASNKCFYQLLHKNFASNHSYQHFNILTKRFQYSELKRKKDLSRKVNLEKLGAGKKLSVRGFAKVSGCQFQLVLCY